MADEGVLRKYTERISAGDGEAGPGDADSVDDLGCFGWLRGQRERAVCLVLRKKSGSSLALNYGFIERIELDPSEGITIVAGRAKVTIGGRNVNAEVRPGVRLFEGLAQHRVSWVREVQGVDGRGLDQRCYIDAIAW